MNNCTFSGRLGRNAEQRYTPSGVAVLSFPLAVDLGWGDNKRTLWIRCNLWGKRAEGRLVDHLAKGAQVVVSGEIDLREYEKRDGTKGHSLELRVAGIDLVGGRQAKNTAGADQTAQEPRSGNPITGDDFDDDIPF